MPRIALGLAYDGTAFEGWQTQPHGNTVQDALEKALSDIACAPVKTVCAGRTDAGVHALGQVAHFDTSADRPLQAWVRGCNALLPSNCAVQSARAVPEDFNARFSATHWQYHYWIYRAPNRHPLVKTAAWVFQPLNVENMMLAMPAVLGEHDFSAFRAAQCQANTPIRTLQTFQLQTFGPYLKVTLQANAFLHHMARNLMGSLLEIGMGNQPPEWLLEILLGRDRRRAAKTAPACGLALVQVGYDDAFGLPLADPNAFTALPMTQSPTSEV